MEWLRLFFFPVLASDMTYSELREVAVVASVLLERLAKSSQFFDLELSSECAITSFSKRISPEAQVSFWVFQGLFVLSVIRLWHSFSSLLIFLHFIQHLKSLQHPLWNRRWPTCRVVCIIQPWEEGPHTQTRGRPWQVFQTSCWKCMRGTTNQAWRQALQVSCHFLEVRQVYMLWPKDFCESESKSV